MHEAEKALICGGDEVDEVAWYEGNRGDDEGSCIVGQRRPMDLVCMT